MKINKISILFIIKNLLSFLTLIFICIFLFKLFINNKNFLLNYDWHFQIYYFILSIVLIMFSTFISSIIWIITLNIFHIKIPLNDGMLIWIKSHLSNYIPGNIWFFIHRTLLGYEYKIPVSINLTSTLMQNGYAVLIMSFFSFISLLILKINIYYILKIIILIILIFIILLGLNINFVNFLITALKKILKKYLSPYPATHRQHFFILLLFLLNKLMEGIGIYFFILGIGIKFNYFFLYPLLIFAVSWLSGFLVFFMPSGIGVRESIMVLLFNNFLNPSLSIIISIALRIMQTFRELCMLYILLIINFLLKLKYNERNIK